MKNIKTIVLLAFTFVLVGCNKTKENSKDELKILIRTNNDCTNILTIDKRGNGELIRGVGNSYKEDFTKLESEDESFSFSIKSDEDIAYINNMSDSISKEDTFKGGFLNDAPHYELYVNGDKKIDAYGTKSVAIHSILKKVWKNLSKEINYYCE